MNADKDKAAPTCECIAVRDSATGLFRVRHCAAHILAFNAYDAHRQLAEAAHAIMAHYDERSYFPDLEPLRAALAAVDAVEKP